jgi:hypothetical protein
MDIVREAELAIERLQAQVREQIAKNMEEDANRNKPNLERLRALGMIE